MAARRAASRPAVVWLSGRRYGWCWTCRYQLDVGEHSCFTEVGFSDPADAADAAAEHLRDEHGVVGSENVAWPI